MKIALIPPIPDLDTFEHSGIHLLLSHLLEDERYSGFYRDRRASGDYLILDNSAHEYGVGTNAEKLLEQARDLKAQEVVLPDILFDSNGTVEATRKMLRFIRNHYDVYQYAGEPRLMIVPQGNNRGEWVKCLNGMLEDWDETLNEGCPIGDPVIGVSKDYDDIVKGGIKSLIKDYLKGYEVHCLGWPRNLWALADVQRECPWVRSTDSAKPFAYARAGILLEPGGKVPMYPRRPADYFDTPLDPDLRSIAERNVAVFDAAATDQILV